MVPAPAAGGGRRARAGARGVARRPPPRRGTSGVAPAGGAAYCRLLHGPAERTDPGARRAGARWRPRWRRGRPRQPGGSRQPRQHGLAPRADRPRAGRPALAPGAPLGALRRHRPLQPGAGRGRRALAPLRPRPARHPLGRALPPPHRHRGHLERRPDCRRVLHRAAQGGPLPADPAPAHPGLHRLGGPALLRPGGVDWRGTARAAFNTYVLRREVKGGSTITQQTAKAILVSAEGFEEGTRRNLRRKVREPSWRAGWSGPSPRSRSSGCT